MSLGNVRNVLRVPGRLSIAPSSVSSGSYPWGGTALGVVDEVALVPNQSVYWIRAEEHGGLPAEGVRVSERWMLVATLRTYDADALGKLFPDKGTGTTTQHPTVGSAMTVGSKVSARAVVLVFTPDDVDHHPMVVFHQAYPAVEEAARIALSAGTRWGIPTAWYAGLDANSKDVTIAMRHDVSL